MGTAGATGPIGSTGATGTAGAGTIYYVSAGFELDAHAAEYGEALCPASPSGLHVLRGGVLVDDLSDDQVLEEFPSDGTGTHAKGTTAWIATVGNGSATTEDIVVFAICGSGTANATNLALPAGLPQGVKPAHPVSS
ncbi:MAG TPA: hypothetical protein VH063_16455 [Gaiellaceae bacterium]|jgi:hypothetical protein|nr:hypothetical protein [Gaiellaceae bacterium]